MQRSLLVDLVKVLASQLILLHHLALYAPMADTLAQAWPALIDGLVLRGPLAVQVFLVMGGFLAAQALQRRPDADLGQRLWQRYLRLAPPLAGGLLLVMAATLMVGRDLAGADWVSPLPGPGALLAHLLLLQDVLGIPSILAGAWYVAIDMQLYLLLAALVWLGTRAARRWATVLVPGLLALATAAGILVFNRQPDLDVWGLYFLPAYGLGALAAGASRGRTARWCWWAAVAVLLVDWWLDPRERPLWTLAAALALWAGAGRPWGAWRGAVARGIQRLSDGSYGVLVVHFALIVLASGLWLRWGLGGLPLALAVCVLVALASVVLGAAVQAGADRLVARWMARGRLAPSR